MKINVFATEGKGDCFFHAVFGVKNSVGAYSAPAAPLMRQEWHSFLNQFDSLSDFNMP